MQIDVSFQRESALIWGGGSQGFTPFDNLDIVDMRTAFALWSLTVDDIHADFDKIASCPKLSSGGCIN